MTERVVNSVVNEEMINACEHNSQTVIHNEYEIMKSCNDLMAKLVNVLENIMFNLSKTVELIKQTHNITETIQPFETDYNVWHQFYCDIKCMLTQLQHNYDTNYGNDCHNDCDNDCGVNDEEDNDVNGVVVCHNNDSIDANTYKQVVIESWNQLIHINSGSNDSNDCNADKDEDNVKRDDCSDERSNNNSKHNESKTIKKNKVKTKRKISEKSENNVNSESKHRYVCDWDRCEYSTDNNANFRKHCRVHTGEKPYKCDFDACDYSCSDPTQYLSHRNHFHSQLKQYLCVWPQCSARLKTAKNLRSHIRAKHTNERPHTCEWPACDKAFMSRFELQFHKLSHTGDRPFNCDIEACNRSFSRSSTLTRHKRVSHALQPKQFDCCHCKSKYSRNDDLKRHVKRKHNNIANSERDCSVKSVVSSISEKTDILFGEKKIVIDLRASKQRTKLCAQK